MREGEERPGGTTANLFRAPPHPRWLVIEEKQEISQGGTKAEVIQWSWVNSLYSKHHPPSAETYVKTVLWTTFRKRIFFLGHCCEKGGRWVGSGWPSWGLLCQNRSGGKVNESSTPHTEGSLETVLSVSPITDFHSFQELDPLNRYTRAVA